MELINTNEKCSSPNLKSSPMQILFIHFSQNEEYCFRCGNLYTETLLFNQKYCEECFLCYVTNIKSKDSKLPFITDSHTYLDLHISTKWQCDKHETSRNEEFYTRDIREWCEECSIISYFKQIPSNSLAYCDNNLNFEIEKNKEVIESEKDCEFCGKIIYPSSLLPDLKLKMCSNCYQISCGSVESTLTKEKEIISVLHLPWWDAFDVCVICKVRLIFEDINQKVCPHCFIIYSGCRYCLTTNIIFGYTNQSQCKKCKREISIVMNKTNISIGNNEIDDFFYNTRNIINDRNIVDYMKDTDKYDDNPLNVYKYLKEKTYENFNPEAVMEWIPYDRIKDLKEITRGGFSTIYQATWSDGGIIGTAYSSCYRVRNETIAIKKSRNLQHILNELKSYHHCYNKSGHILRCYGVTKEPETKEYMLVMKYADGKILRHYLQNNFNNVTWKIKLELLLQISNGLESIHNANFVHRDFHSGNILFDLQSGKKLQCQIGIGDLGLSYNLSNNKIYGVIPYIAPEIFRGSAFSKESDVYSLGMVMWEFTTGCKPFDNVEHDHNLIYQIIDGKRPEITDDTPVCFANLMKSCWNSDPKKRPSIKEIYETFSSWSLKNKKMKLFEKAEIKRRELVNSKKLCPEFNEKPHTKAIFTSRSYSMITLNTRQAKQEYNIEELDLDINNIQSLQSSLIVNSLRKRNIEELKIENKNSGKHIKTDDLGFLGLECNGFIDHI